MTLTTVTATVPAGKTMNITLNGVTYELTVPDGVMVGQQVRSPRAFGGSATCPLSRTPFPPRMTPV